MRKLNQAMKWEVLIKIFYRAYMKGKTVSKLLEFEKLHNTRDLGGMKTMDGRVIKEGRLFRSGHLSDLALGDKAVLSGLIDRAVDLRTALERDRQPDQPMEGVENIHIPIMESLTSGITREKEADRNAFTRFRGKPEEAKRYMCEVYRSFAGDFAVKQYSNFIKLLAGKESRTPGIVLREIGRAHV